MKRKKGVEKTTTEWSNGEMTSSENLNLHKEMKIKRGNG